MRAPAYLIRRTEPAPGGGTHRFLAAMDPVIWRTAAASAARFLTAGEARRTVRRLRLVGAGVVKDYDPHGETLPREVGR